MPLLAGLKGQPGAGSSGEIQLALPLSPCKQKERPLPTMHGGNACGGAGPPWASCCKVRRPKQPFFPMESIPSREIPRRHREAGNPLVRAALVRFPAPRGEGRRGYGRIPPLAEPANGRPSIRAASPAGDFRLPDWPGGRRAALARLFPRGLGSARFSLRRNSEELRSLTGPAGGTGAALRGHAGGGLRQRRLGRERLRWVGGREGPQCP